MLKKSASFVLGLSKFSTGTRPPHHSAARKDVVLLSRRTVRPRGYASGFDSPAALLDSLFEHPLVELFLELLPHRVRIQFRHRLAALDVLVQDRRHIRFRHFGAPGGVRVDDDGWSLLAGT